MEKKRKTPDSVNQLETFEPISMDSSTSEYEQCSKSLNQVPLLISVSFVVQIVKPLTKENTQIIETTAAMHKPEDVFVADLYYHAHCCKDYFNKYNADIEEIFENLEEEDAITA
ncbi:Hypothetical predicted protein [Paramuricea clavata]|uniref:Uncharacterized protein n=1 Tax=Paramuricea clavata TaxID=317549 RepID=A0A7D9HEE3_PARCT|nr:Hypothetical predicted protein [Paramuricea clavata]